METPEIDRSTHTAEVGTIPKRAGSRTDTLGKSWDQNRTEPFTEIFLKPKPESEPILSNEVYLVYSGSNTKMYL